jgi:hypothetical protein
VWNLGYRARRQIGRVTSPPLGLNLSRGRSSPPPGGSGKSLNARRPYKPGDFVVTPFSGGFMLARVLDGSDDGPWWEYIRAEVDLGRALVAAQHLASHHHSRAWVNDRENRFQEIPLQDPPTHNLQN